MSRRRSALDTIAAMARAQGRRFRAEVAEHGLGVAVNVLALMVADLPDVQRRAFGDSLATFESAKAEAAMLMRKISGSPVQ